MIRPVNMAVLTDVIGLLQIRIKTHEIRKNMKSLILYFLIYSGVSSSKWWMIGFVNMWIIKSNKSVIIWRYRFIHDNNWIEYIAVNP